ncbi:MAG TPA: hypothetical protein VF989_13670 [Polyangiaceae bacterium]
MQPRLASWFSLLTVCGGMVSAKSAAAEAEAAGQSDLQAGGLAPPDAAPETAAPPPYSETENDLRRAEEKDSGRGLEFFWLNGEIGVNHLGLQTFNANDLVDAEIVESTQTGLLFGGGLGLRLIFLTLGARFRLGTFSDWQLWTLNLEAGLRIPFGAVEPYFTFGGGYASIGSFDAGNIGSGFNSDGVDITGFNLRGGFGLDVYLSENFSIGGNLTGDLMFLKRPRVEMPDVGNLPPEQAMRVQEVYGNDGSSIGAGTALTFVAGLHF